MKKHLIFIIAMAFTIKGFPSGKIEWISTTNENAWNKNISVSFDDKEVSGTPVVINTQKTVQVINGFGGCFNELGLEALNSLAESDKKAIIKELFDTLSGCKFNICRMPIGANDYAINWYSLDETPGDYEMKNFSIDRDKKKLIPYIHEAMVYNPQLKIWASPWCPPSWMKKNNHYACRPDVVNDLPKEGEGKEMQDQFIMDDQHLSAYALYFVKFVKAYQQEGINLYAVHVQNEPNSCQNFPSCVWTPSSLATFIGKYLGPQFKKNNLNAEIWLGTIERPQIERIDTIIQNPDARQYIEGMGFQWAGKDAIPLVNKKYPGLKLMQTETECGDGSNDWKAAEHTFELMKHYFENGANAYMYWNMVLDETGKSQWGWKQNSMISINTKEKTFRYNPEFYLMKHFCYFVEPGARKLALDKENSTCLAFKNAGSVIIFFYNPGNTQEVSFKVDNKHFKVTLTEKSFNTFKIIL